LEFQKKEIIIYQKNKLMGYIVKKLISVFNHLN